jgi:hypothetical protein
MASRVPFTDLELDASATLGGEFRVWGWPRAGHRRGGRHAGVGKIAGCSFRRGARVIDGRSGQEYATNKLSLQAAAAKPVVYEPFSFQA